MKPYTDHLNVCLTDPNEAAAYLVAAMEDGGKDVLRMALADIARANGVDGEATRPSSGPSMPWPDSAAGHGCFVDYDGVDCDQIYPNCALDEHAPWCDLTKDITRREECPYWKPVQVAKPHFACDFGGAFRDCEQEKSGQCAYAADAGFTRKESCRHWVKVEERG